jgi:hypothetical protein
MPELEENSESNYLPSSGFTKTSVAHHQWVGKVVKEARALFGEQPVRARMWSYRESGYDYLSCDLFAGDASLPVTICACGEAYLPEVTGGAAEADVCDMPDALHVAGMIARALSADVELGLGQNEVNDQVLAQPLSPGQTNGPINLRFGDDVHS